MTNELTLNLAWAGVALFAAYPAMVNRDMRPMQRTFYLAVLALLTLTVGFWSDGARENDASLVQVGWEFLVATGLFGLLAGVFCLRRKENLKTRAIGLLIAMLGGQPKNVDAEQFR
jgi:hypothetical protein